MLYITNGPSPCSELAVGFDELCITHVSSTWARSVNTQPSSETSPASWQESWSGDSKVSKSCRRLERISSTHGDFWLRVTNTANTLYNKRNTVRRVTNTANTLYNKRNTVRRELLTQQTHCTIRETVRRESQWVRVTDTPHNKRNTERLVTQELLTQQTHGSTGDTDSKSQGSVINLILEGPRIISVLPFSWKGRFLLCWEELLQSTGQKITPPWLAAASPQQKCADSLPQLWSAIDTQILKQTPAHWKNQDFFPGLALWNRHHFGEKVVLGQTGGCQDQKGVKQTVTYNSVVVIGWFLLEGLHHSLGGVEPPDGLMSQV